MNNIYFWKAWQNPYRILISGMLIFLLLLIISTLILHVLGTEGLIGWSVLSFQSGYTALIEIIEIGPFAFELAAPRLQIIEFFEGGNMPDAGQFSGPGMGLIAFAAIIYLTAISYFKRFWYLLGIAAFMAFIIFSHPEYLQLFGWSNRSVLVLFFGILFIPSYYLHAYVKSQNFSLRLLVTLASILILGILIALFAEIKHPFGGMFNYGLLASFIITLVFIITVSHEIIRVFLKVTSTNLGSSGRSRLRHFLILTLIYWVNVLFTYLKITHVIEWDIVFLDPFLLLSISALLGFWGLHKRSVLYAGASSSTPLWLLTYLALAIVSYTFIFYLAVGLNDPLLSVVGDFIIYSHLASGMAFLLYVIYNFMPVIEKGYDAEQVLYNPSNLPYFTYRLVGILGIVALISMRGLNYPVWYAMGGYYNAIADYYQSKDDTDLARIYYIKASDFAFINHKANYSLGLATLEDNRLEAKDHYIKALRGEPLAQAFVNIANIQDLDQAYFKSLFTLQEGIQVLPDNLQIANNLALQFEKSNLIDSAMFYLDEAGTKSLVINSNRMALSTRYDMTLGSDSSAVLTNLTLGGKANATNLGVFDFNLATLNGDYLFDKVMLNNWLLSNEPAVLDSTLFSAMAIIDSTEQVDNNQELNFALSIAAFRTGAVNEAIIRLQVLIATAQERAVEYVETLGTYYMVLGDFSQALEPLEEAITAGSPTASFKLAVALSELGLTEEAIGYWEKLKGQDDTDLAKTASTMIAVLSNQNFEPKDDYEKYLHVRYQRLNLDEIELLLVIKTISDQNIKARACLDLANYYYEHADFYACSLFLEQFPDIISNLALVRSYHLLSMNILAQSEALTSQGYEDFISDFGFDRNEYLLDLFYRAELQMPLDSTDYLHLGKDNAYFVDGILTAAAYFENDPDEFKAYNFIADALSYNPNSGRLLYAYVIQATKLGFLDYAEKVLFQFSQKYPGQWFNQLLKEHELLKQQFENLVEPEE